MGKNKGYKKKNGGKRSEKGKRCQSNAEFSANKRQKKEREQEQEQPIEIQEEIEERMQVCEDLPNAPKNFLKVEKRQPQLMISTPSSQPQGLASHFSSSPAKRIKVNNRSRKFASPTSLPNQTTAAQDHSTQVQKSTSSTGSKPVSLDSTTPEVTTKSPRSLVSYTTPESLKVNAERPGSTSSADSVFFALSPSNASPLKHTNLMSLGRKSLPAVVAQADARRSQAGVRIEKPNTTKKTLVLKEMKATFLNILDRKIPHDHKKKDDLSDDGWSPQEVRKLRFVHAELSRICANAAFWKSVASRMAPRTASECSRKFQSLYPTPTKKTKKKHSQTLEDPEPSPLHEKKNTIKRRRKLRALHDKAEKNFAGHDAYAGKEGYGFDLDVSFDDEMEELFCGRTVYEDDSNSDKDKSPKPYKRSPGLLKPLDHAAVDGYIQKLKKRPAPRELLPLKPLRLTFKTDAELQKDVKIVAKASRGLDKAEILEEDVISDYYFSEKDSSSSDH